jgi:hypothetical protein
MWGEIVVPVPAQPMFLAWARNDELGEAIVGSALKAYDAWHQAGAGGGGARDRRRRSRFRYDPERRNLRSVIRCVPRLAESLRILTASGGARREPIDMTRPSPSRQ